MADPITSLPTIQKQMLDAQRASMAAFHQQLGIGDSLIAFQEAGRKAAEAGLNAWSAWGRMWGLKYRSSGGIAEEKTA